MLCTLMSDLVLPLASIIFVFTYWAIGLFYYYTWPEMQELCIEWKPCLNVSCFKHNIHPFERRNHTFKHRLDNHLLDSSFNTEYTVSFSESGYSICFNWSTVNRRLLVIFMISIIVEKEFYCLDHFLIMSHHHLFLAMIDSFLITWLYPKTEVKNIKKCGGFYNWMFSGQSKAQRGNVWKYYSAPL